MPFVKEMENNFYRDDFEQMLKDTTEDFRMYPSRKVWHSIYNDLHPDRKWPSFAVCLLLLTAILYIGVSNNNQISKTAIPLIASNINAGLQTEGSVFNKLPGDNSNGTEAAAATQSAQVITQPRLLNLKVNTDYSVQSLSQKEKGDFTPAIAQATIAGSHGETSISNTASTQTKPDNNIISSLEKTYSINTTALVSGIANTGESTAQQKNLPTNEHSISANETEVALEIPVNSNNNILQVATDNQATVKTQQAAKTLSLAEKAWIEDFAFHNLRNPGKWKTNLSFQYYITPSIGYRHLNKNNEFEPVNGSLITLQENDEVTQQAAPNFEAGAVMILGLGKRLKVKSGLQFNYTSYNIYAHQLQHPTQTTVPMNDDRTGYLLHQPYNTTYGNVLGSNLTRLNNKTLQLSLPIGIDYKVAGSNKISWYMGAGVQPSFIMSGDAYLISSDNKNFVQDDAMLRKWNTSANVETFVSIKTPSGIHINVGPQFRYQLLSTYVKKYGYTEKLYNMGLKIAVTKKL